MYELNKPKEKAIAVSVVRKGTDRELAWEHLNELEFLADTAGAEVIEKIYQELDKPNKATVVGKGKLEDIKFVIDRDEINLMIFDDDLSPAQVRNLENALKVKVIDRSGLILDIFAERAKTVEAKTQVELAQMQYMLPRLTRMWTHLSKQYGGIGTRGPGETQIETDRRLIRLRIQKLKEKLEDITVQREQQRKGRETMPQFALVGYTNAGKSTLMNVLSDAGSYVENKLFATLDTTVRVFELAKGQKALISDTVGFIRKLPAHLVASFRSTLAEAAEADFLLHVVDVSHPYFQEQIKVVNDTLSSLKIKDKNIILVFNKIDLLEDFAEMKSLENEYPESIFISAGRGINIQNLLDLMKKRYEEGSNFFDLIVPYEKHSVVANLYKMSEILEQKEEETGTYYKVKVHPENIDYFKNTFNQLIRDNHGK